ncbi:MAG: hypothetical protein HY744_16000, partial [Deltaproteobacteria bacterium]|nr:hypothetical protein [Deltaproteobacteria bacterium]
WATVASARPHASAAPSAYAPGSAATAAVEPPACSGEIHLYAAHGWVVSGGPSPVQAPGRYRWPCGRYSLTAISRVDPADRRSAQATVRDGASAVVDLR